MDAIVGNLREHLDEEIRSGVPQFKGVNGDIVFPHDSSYIDEVAEMYRDAVKESGPEDTENYGVTPDELATMDNASIILHLVGLAESILI